MNKHKKEKEKLKSFFKEYQKICKKYGYFVTACGCCDSPWILDGDEERLQIHFCHLKKVAKQDFNLKEGDLK